MPRLAFKMKLFKGYEEEYKRRHAAIWPALKQLLQDAGISDYSIFLDEETGFLFATLKVTDEKNLHTLPANEIMKSWWSYMKDIMETNEDESPVSIPLKKVFHLKKGNPKIY